MGSTLFLEKNFIQFFLDSFSHFFYFPLTAVNGGGRVSELVVKPHRFSPNRPSGPIWSTIHFQRYKKKLWSKVLPPFFDGDDTIFGSLRSLPCWKSVLTKFPGWSPDVGIHVLLQILLEPGGQAVLTSWNIITFRVTYIWFGDSV